MKSQLIIADMMIEIAVAKFFRILSANFITTAMISPPPPLTRTKERPRPPFELRGRQKRLDYNLTAEMWHIGTRPTHEISARAS